MDTERLSLAARLQADEAVRENPKGLMCPMIADFPISTLACESRRRQFEESGRERHHLCAGEECPGWNEDYAALEVDFRTAPRMQSAPKPKPKKEAKMKKGTRFPTNPAEGCYAGIPAEERPELPEGYRYTRNGTVQSPCGNRVRPCPECGEGGVEFKSARCRKCAGNNSDKGGAHGRAAKPKVKKKTPEPPATPTPSQPEPKAEGQPPEEPVEGITLLPQAALPSFAPSDEDMRQAIGEEMEELTELLFSVWRRVKRRIYG